ncbi:pyridoxal-phosphate-dependent/plp-dependent aminotransferase, partial [Escherichia coli]
QNTLIALPCGWWLDEDQIHHMIDVINDSLGLVESGRWIDD